MEQNYRLSILNSLLNTPHRALSEPGKLHEEVAKKDSFFYPRLALWYFDKGNIKDHKELFAAHLLSSEYAYLREIGKYLLRKLPPYQIARVVKYMSKTLGKVPRSTKTAVRTLLREIEANDSRFDRAAVRSRKALKFLYASLRIKPSLRADSILFKGKPPENSLPYVVKLMNSTSEPTEQAKLITNYRIPYPVAAGCVKEMTPSVLEALIGVMSGQELINNIASIKKHGAFQHGNLKATVVGKLLEAKKDVKVQALKAQRAKEAGSSDDHEISSVLDEVTDARLSLVKISKPTALLVDKSGSMEEAISIAKKLASLIAQATTSDFHCYVFDTLSREIPRPSEGDTYSSWEKAFKEVRAYGGTSIGIALREMAEVGVKVEQIVIVTDARENCRPFFSEAYAQYEKATGMRPNVVVVHTKIYSPLFSKNLEKLGIPVDTYDFTGDYYSLPNILPMLGKDSTLDLLKEILNMKLEVAKVGEAG